MKFSELGLNKDLIVAVDAAGYKSPTPIQVAAIPPILAGRDVLGSARTGTGKTAAFVLPLIQRLEQSWNAARIHRVRSLILSPTRELALQLFQTVQLFTKETKLTSLLVHGGVSFDEQIDPLEEGGIDVLVATPGRLLDLMERKALKFDQLEVFVVDEADQMLDFGFAPDIHKIVELLPQKRQALLFSATMTNEAQKLARSFLIKPQCVSVDPQSSVADNIDKVLYYVEKNNKFALMEWLLNKGFGERVLIFCRTRRGADRLCARLQQGALLVDVIHGEKSQKRRRALIEDFRAGTLKVLVATDLAARGIDIDGITHVVNFDLPNEIETFVHRIGRTARAGATGQAVSFCDASEKLYLREIVMHLREDFVIEKDHPFHSEQILHYSGQSVHNKERKRKSVSPSKKGLRTKWSLTPSQLGSLHKQKVSPSKNARNNPKKKSSK